MTSELHDSYFRLMTIKHSISKIAWAIKWALNYCIAQSRQKSSQLSCSSVRVPVGESCGRESHTRPKGLSGALMELGSREERHNADGHNSGVKIFQLYSVSSSLSHVNLE